MPPSSNSPTIAHQVSRLLDVYGPEAVECLDTLGDLLKDRVDSEVNINVENATASSEKHENDTLPEPSMDALPTVGDIENIVLQTVAMESDGGENDELAAATTKESLAQAGMKVLRYWSILKTKNTNQPSYTSSDHDTVVDTICQIMTQYPQNEEIQESACVRLSNNSQSLLISSTTTPSSSTTIFQRILFPVLQAMNWHKHNPLLWNAGMIILASILTKNENDDLTERQNQAIAMIEMTGGLHIFFEALHKQPPKKNVNVGRDLKVHVCRALAALALNHPDNQALIAQHPELSTILDTMKLMAFDLALQQASLQLLASLAYGVDSKPILLAKGGLDCILTCMKDYDLDPSIQATGCRAIANIFAGTSTDIRAKGSLCVKPTLRAMRMHPPTLLGEESSSSTLETEEESSSVSAVQIHFYGSAALRNLSKVHARAVVEAGGLSTLLITLSSYQTRPAIQEQAWGAVYFLLKTATKEDCHAIVLEGGLEILWQSLTHFYSHLRIQTVCMGCLHFLSAVHHLPTTEQLLSSGRALDVVLSTLHRYHRPHQRRGSGNSDLLQHGCNFLTNVLTDYPDAQLPMIIKNGINLMIMILQEHPVHPKQQPSLPLAAGQVILLICRNHENLDQVMEMTSNDAILSTILVGFNQSKHPKKKTKRLPPANMELTACSIETLAHLATLPSIQKDLIARHPNGLQDVLQTIQNQSEEESILKVGILLLLHLSKDPDATLWMKNHDLVFWLQGMHMSLPRRSLLRNDIQTLLNHLRTTRVFLTKFTSLTRR